MRVLIVNTFYCPNMQGGAEQSVKLLAEGLHDVGHTVGVFSIDNRWQDGNIEIDCINGVHIFRVSPAPFDLFRFCYDKKRTTKTWKVRQKLYCYFNAELMRRFEAVCLEFKPDVLHTNSMNGVPCAIWKSARKLGVPVVHTVRDLAPLSPYVYGHKENPAIVALHRLYYRNISKNVNAITAPSQYTLNTSLARGSFCHSQISKRVFNCVSIDDDKLRQSIRLKCARCDGAIRYMYAGRLLASKGVRTLLDAFNNLEANAELHICGQGELKPLVEERAAKDVRIVFHGMLESHDLNELYEYCDVLVVPSEWPEPFGRVVIEGNLHGMPVIAANTGGIPEILDVTRGGSLFESGSIDALVFALRRYAKRSVIRGAIEHIADGLVEFSLERQIREFENIYFGVVA